RHDNFHFVAEIAVPAGHDGEGHEPGTIHGDRIGTSIEARDMQTAGAHRLDLGCVRLHREKYDLFAGDLFHVLYEAVPYLRVDRRIFDWRVGKNQGWRIDELFWIAWGIGHQVAVAIAIGLVEIAARTILRAGRCHQTPAYD